MASSSSHPRRYHVFPSFCGEDVRRNFLSHFHKELQLNGIDAFKDGGIKRSRSIWPELKQAIWESRVSIVVLSKNYGGSSWCLDELVEIMECKEVSGQTVMPIFYEEERQRWKQALTSVASIAGDCSSKWDNDAVMIERIVTNVLQELNWCTPSKDFKDLVGLEAHVSNLNSMLCLDTNEVKIIGIWGPAGIGKTTIARALYNQLSSSGDEFQLNLFMENVKGVQMRKELHGYSLKLHLQERFLSEIFNQRTKISHLGVAQERLKNQKALVVLDDVDGLEQLNALIDTTEWFGYGTRIIVTTEDRQLLKAHGINQVYEVGYPSQGLSVLGASLRGLSKEEWINAIPRLRTSLNGKIEKLLGVCYDGLDEKDKTLFLHVACLFNGEKVDRVKQLLAKSALDADFGLKVLVDRSLIHIYADGYIVMHFLLQQMGKEIIRGQCINDPGRRQFLVDAQEISDVLVDETGTKNVLGISLDMSELDDEVYISEKAFKKMTNLQFLRLYNHFPDEAVKLQLPHGLDYLPRKLRLLHRDSYPIKCMPSKFRPEFLVELTLRDSKLVKLWEGVQPLTSLTYMDLSSSKNIKDIPNLSGAMNLEKLYLRFCENLVTVSSSSLQNLNKLKVLDMSCCTKLKALPTNINLESLSVLNLRGCSKLKRFPCISTQVQFMSLGETAIEKVPSLIRLCSRLVSLEMAGCKNLKTLPPVPASIEILDLSKTRVEFIYVDHMHMPFICLFGDRC